MREDSSDFVLVHDQLCKQAKYIRDSVTYENWERATSPIHSW